ncbi:tRNA (guanosine(18)-2'-O)-methyltransferase TrmH [Endozoicomonas sp. Mp262]|uniref:tRNA (guanosine(18)-2'-O)-methyltransferase TrmH n=1 Tax=Endozoicomonas sp. Mp262 TaxID=2919499 RepID=UPI0021D80312
MTPERYQKFRAILDRRQPDLTVLTDQVHKNHNLSAIIRTCDAVGIHQIHITQPKKGYRHFRRRSMGSHQWVDLQFHNSIKDSAAYLKSRGFKIYAAHFSDKAIPFNEVDYAVPCALLLGAEKNGVSPEGARLADKHIIIPMQGMVSSYNVSVAAAIILVEAQRQRLEKGMYDHVRLTEALYNKTLFQWGYPELTRYCDERRLAYPDINDSGQLIDPSGWYAKVRAYQQPAIE